MVKQVEKTQTIEEQLHHDFTPHIHDSAPHIEESTPKTIQVSPVKEVEPPPTDLIASDIDSLPGLETDYELLTPPSSPSSATTLTPQSSTYSASSYNTFMSLPSLATCTPLESSSGTLSPFETESNSESLVLNNVILRTDTGAQTVRIGTQTPCTGTQAMESSLRRETR